MEERGHGDTAQFEVNRSLIEDADGYERSVRGVQIQSVRTGRGSRHNAVLTALGSNTTISAVSAGFPMVNRTVIGHDRCILAVVRSTPAGARWCNIDLEPGMVVLFGPEAHHIGVNPDGTSFAFVAVEIDVVRELAGDLGLALAEPERGAVAVVAPSQRTKELASTMSSLVSSLSAGFIPDVRVEEDVLHRVASALSIDTPLSRHGRRVDLHSRAIVEDCCGYAEATGRIPSIRALCLVASVSERRLRQAFVDSCGVAPSEFFRLWALNKAHRQLAESDTPPTTVTDVAFNLGIRHLGRFSGRYRELFGELPKETLRANLP